MAKMTRAKGESIKEIFLTQTNCLFQSAHLPLYEFPTFLPSDLLTFSFSQLLILTTYALRHALCTTPILPFKRNALSRKNRRDFTYDSKC
jgi:hypothetical protein